MVAQQIPVDGLTIGMCVVGVDRSCLPHTSLGLPQRVENLQGITILTIHGVCDVTVDFPQSLNTSRYGTPHHHKTMRCLELHYEKSK